MQGNSACVRYFGVSSLRRAFTTLLHYAENECAMPIGLHCSELRALCLTTNALCRTAEIGALLLKYVLIVYIWPEKGVYWFAISVSGKRGSVGSKSYVYCKVSSTVLLIL